MNEIENSENAETPPVADETSAGGQTQAESQTETTDTAAADAAGGQ